MPSHLDRAVGAATGPRPFALILFGTQANASTVYAYNGLPFTNVEGAYTDTNFVSGSVTLASPLTINLDQVVTPTAFSFSDGVQTITSNAVSFDIFEFQTDFFGNIVTWNVFLQSSECQVDFGCSIETTLEPAEKNDSVNFATNQSNSFGFNTNQPGQWTVAATPLPGALPLFAGGLSMIGLIARRKRQKNASALPAI